MTGSQQTDSNRPALRVAERGAVLVLFALFIVGLFGLLGVVVDGGRLRVTKQQLDAGAESAALEGVRFKDLEGDDSRRTRAITAIQRQWDDDLDASNGDRIGLGAGTQPIVNGANPLGGRTDFATSRAARVFKPGLSIQANESNAAYGDFVAGTFVASGAPIESNQFKRADFEPLPRLSAADELADAPAFLARLRRAGSQVALDRQPSESSAGPAFEWLWARGSAWQEPGVNQTGQSRADGLTVRAASIASTERALVVSNDLDANISLAPFALLSDAVRGADSSAAWTRTPVGQSLALEFEATGALTLNGIEQGIVPTIAPRTIAEDVAPVAAAIAPTPPAGLLIVPVYGAFGSTRTIAGFALATATLAGTTLTVIRRDGAVLPRGASSVSPAALDSRIALFQQPQLRALHNAIAAPVRAPVLRR